MQTLFWHSNHQDTTVNTQSSSTERIEQQFTFTPSLPIYSRSIHCQFNKVAADNISREEIPFIIVLRVSFIISVSALFASSDSEFVFFSLFLSLQNRAYGVVSSTAFAFWLEIGTESIDGMAPFTVFQVTHHLHRTVMRQFRGDHIDDVINVQFLRSYRQIQSRSEWESEWEWTKQSVREWVRIKMYRDSKLMIF